MQVAAALSGDDIHGVALQHGGVNPRKGTAQYGGEHTEDQLFLFYKIEADALQGPADVFRVFRFREHVAAAGADTGLWGLGLYVFTHARSPPFAEASTSLLVVLAFGCVVFAFSVCVAFSCCAMSPTWDW